MTKIDFPSKPKLQVVFFTFSKGIRVFFILLLLGANIIKCKKNPPRSLIAFLIKKVTGHRYTSIIVENQN